MKAKKLLKIFLTIVAILVFVKGGIVVYHHYFSFGYLGGGRASCHHLLPFCPRIKRPRLEVATVSGA